PAYSGPGASPGVAVRRKKRPALETPGLETPGLETHALNTWVLRGELAWLGRLHMKHCLAGCRAGGLQSAASAGSCLRISGQPRSASEILLTGSGHSIPIPGSS